MKTRKSVASKFKVTGTGKLVHRSPGKRHYLAHKRSKNKRQLGKPRVLSEALTKTYKRMMGV